MKFFTDKTVINDYLLIKINDYRKLMSICSPSWKEILIDPGVYELKNSIEYSWVTKGNWVEDWIKHLPENHYFSWDYPPDMNVRYTDYFLEKSWQNALKYERYPQYIVTVQSKFNNYWNFVEWFDKYNTLEIVSNILGIGNMCRFRGLNQFIKHALDYAFSNCNSKRIHIYGLNMKAIPYAYKLSKQFNIEFSFDSTKWTRPFWTSGLSSCKGEDRQLYFDLYKAEIEKRCSIK